MLVLKDLEQEEESLWREYLQEALPMGRNSFVILVVVVVLVVTAADLEFGKDNAGKRGPRHLFQGPADV